MFIDDKMSENGTAQKDRSTVVLVGASDLPMTNSVLDRLSLERIDIKNVEVKAAGDEVRVELGQTPTKEKAEDIAERVTEILRPTMSHWGLRHIRSEFPSGTASLVYGRPDELHIKKTEPATKPARVN